MSSTHAQRLGWYACSWANHGYITVAATVFLGRFLVVLAKVAAGCAAGSACQGRYLHPLGIPVAPGAYFPYLVTVGTLLTALVIPMVGAIADRTGHRKRLLIAFSYPGAAAACALSFVGDDAYLTAGGLYLLATICLQAAAVLQNAYLPTMADADGRDSVSCTGFAAGYLGGALLLTGSLVLVQLKPAGTLQIARWCILASGVWWALFTVVPALLLPTDRPGAARATVATSTAATSTAATSRSSGAVSGGFRDLGRVLRGLARSFPLTLLFLIAFLIYNDGIKTVISQASVYATNQLLVSQSVLVLTILVVQFVAVGGALLFGRLARWVGARRALLASLVVWTLVTLAAFWLPPQQSVPFVVLGVVMGLVLGGSQVLSRSLFSQQIPPGSESAYFGVYAVDGLGTSWIGTLMFGLVYQFTFDYRWGIVSLLAFFVVGAVLLMVVPLRRAIQVAGNPQPSRL